VKKISVEGHEQKTPEGQVMRIPAEGQVKRKEPSSHQGRCTMTSTP